MVFIAGEYGSTTQNVSSYDNSHVADLKYDAEDKEEIIEDMVKNELTAEQVSDKWQIDNPDTVKKWLDAYKKYGVDGLNSKEVTFFGSSNDTSNLEALADAFSFSRNAKEKAQTYLNDRLNNFTASASVYFDSATSSNSYQFSLLTAIMNVLGKKSTWDTIVSFVYFIFQDYGCNMQFGGDDQWANMLGGTELIRKKLGKDAYAMTITLLLNSEGKKMGKTEKGAVWLDPEKTSPYEFYQYWRNVGDADVIKCLKMLTFVPIEEIEEMEKHMEGAEYNKAKELLAYELTKLVHGKEEADKADAAAKAIFAGGGNSDDMPSTTIAAADLTDGKIGILTLLVKCGLCPSNGEARRLVTQNGIAVNGEKFTDPKGLVDLSEPVVIKKGKKIFHKAIAE